MLSLLFGRGRESEDSSLDGSDDKENEGVMRQRTIEALGVLRNFILTARDTTYMEETPSATLEIIFSSINDLSGTMRHYPVEAQAIREALRTTKNEHLEVCITWCTEALEAVAMVEGEQCEVEDLDRIAGFGTLLAMLVCGRKEELASVDISTRAAIAIIGAMTSDGFVEHSPEEEEDR